MRLFAGTSHPALAASLAQELKTEVGRIILKRFAAGECYVKFGQSVRGQEVFLLQAAGRNPHDALFELFLMCQAAKLSFASTVHVVLPYFPYARQDRIAEPREPISARLMARLLEEAGADHVITLNLHSSQIQGFFSVPVDALDATGIFARYFRTKHYADAVVVSPDIGGAKQAKKFADLIGADLAIMHKVRSAHHQAEILDIAGEVSGRSCILFDDMIDTGGTHVSAIRALRERGVTGSIALAATHAVFSGDAPRLLADAGFHEIIVTDSIPNDRLDIPNLTILPIAPLLAEVIRHVERRESVTDIYRQ